MERVPTWSPDVESPDVESPDVESPEVESPDVESVCGVGRGDVAKRRFAAQRAACGSTARGVPPVMRTSSSNVVGNTVFACPAAAHTTG